MPNAPLPVPPPGDRPRSVRLPPTPLLPALPILAPSGPLSIRKSDPQPKRSEMPPPILIPLTPGRIRPHPVVSRPPSRVVKPAPAPLSSSEETRIMGRPIAPSLPAPRSPMFFGSLRPLMPAHSPRPTRPAPDLPAGSLPRMTMEERRKRLLEILLEVEAKLEMLDDPVPC